MKEDIRKRHGYSKTKEVFTFDDGLAERQGAFLYTARPILAALSMLEEAGKEDEEDAPDPDTIKGMLEDALVLLGNATFRLNSWRQKRFSAYLTEIGKRTLKEGIPSDKHLFPHKFHERIKSEHDHSSTNSKLISQPSADKSKSSNNYNRGQAFRGSHNNKASTYDGANDRSGSRKRKWSYGQRPSNNPKRGRDYDSKQEPRGAA